MSLGEMLNKNPMIGVGVAVVILVVAGVIVMRSTGIGDSPNILKQRYFYDMTSGDVIVMDNVPAPVTADSGSTAVWAAVYTCGSCDNESERFVGYLQKYTDQAKSEVAKPLSQQDYDTVNEGTVVAMVPEKAGDELAWFQVETREGMQITQASVQARCPGGMTMPCSP